MVVLIALIEIEVQNNSSSVQIDRQIDQTDRQTDQTDKQTCNEPSKLTVMETE
jgi:hypothetical protein